MDFLCNEEGVLRELYIRRAEEYNKVISLLKVMESDFYPFIRDKNTWYNDHGRVHINAIFKIVNQMLSRYFVMENEITNLNVHGKGRDDFKLRTEDLAVLSYAIIVHDSAMVRGREKHGLNVVNMFQTINKYVGEANLSSEIIDISASHSDKKKFHLLKNVGIVKENIIQCKMLGAILRFADEISEDYTRGMINNQIYQDEIAGTEHELYWLHTKSIDSSNYVYDLRAVVIRYRLDVKQAFQKYKYESDSEKTLFAFVIERIKKVNDERVLCSPFFAQYTPLDSIIINIEFFEEDTNGCPHTIYVIENVPISSYPDEGSNLESFINAYPVFSEQSIIQKVRGGDIV